MDQLVIVEKSGKAWYRMTPAGAEDLSETTSTGRRVSVENVIPPDVELLIRNASKAEKTKSRQTYKKVETSPIFQIFYEAGQRTDDLFWRNFFERMSHNSFRKGFRYITSPTPGWSYGRKKFMTEIPGPPETDSDSSSKKSEKLGILVYKFRAKEFHLPIFNDSEIVFKEVKDFVQKHTCLVSEDDQSKALQCVEDEYGDPFESFPKEWCQVKNFSTKIMLLSHFVEQVKIHHDLSVDQCKSLMTMLVTSVASDKIGTTNIKLHCGMIEDISGLTYDEGSFYIVQNTTSNLSVYDDIVQEDDTPSSPDLLTKSENPSVIISSILSVFNKKTFIPVQKVESFVVETPCCTRIEDMISFYTENFDRIFLFFIDIAVHGLIACYTDEGKPDTSKVVDKAVDYYNVHIIKDDFIYQILFSRELSPSILASLDFFIIKRKPDLTGIAKMIFNDEEICIPGDLVSNMIAKHVELTKNFGYIKSLKKIEKSVKTIIEKQIASRKSKTEEFIKSKTDEYRPFHHMHKMLGKRGILNRKWEKIYAKIRVD